VDSLQIPKPSLQSFLSQFHPLPSHFHRIHPNSILTPRPIFEATSLSIRSFAYVFLNVGFVMLLKPCTFLQSIYQPTCALHIQFMTKIILLHVLEWGAILRQSYTTKEDKYIVLIWFSVLDWHSFVLEGSLRMAPQCQKM